MGQHNAPTGIVTVQLPGSPRRASAATARRSTGRSSRAEGLPFPMRGREDERLRARREEPEHRQAVREHGAPPPRGRLLHHPGGDIDQATLAIEHRHQPENTPTPPEPGSADHAELHHNPRRYRAIATTVTGNSLDRGQTPQQDGSDLVRDARRSGSDCRRTYGILT